MADFTIAYQITAQNEGGWVHNPNDSGGQTAFGIAQNSWGNWPGWLRVIHWKNQLGPEPAYGTQVYHDYAHKLNALCRADTALMKDVTDFYRVNFWNGFDAINNQEVANKLFDAGVNMGIGAAAKIMQRIVGVTVDGCIGPHSIAAINAVDGPTLVQQFKDARIQYYRDIVKTKPQFAQFLTEWESRC